MRSFQTICVLGDYITGMQRADEFCSDCKNKINLANTIEILSIEPITVKHTRERTNITNEH